jgi:hypothetical protein
VRTLLGGSIVRLATWLASASNDARVLLLFLIGASVLGRGALASLVARLSEERGDTRRFLLVILGVAALGASQSAGHRFGEHYWFSDGVLMALLLAFALALFAVALAPPLDRWLWRRSPRLILATAAVSAVVLAGHSSGQIERLSQRIRILPQHTQFGNDAVTMSSCATDLLTRGLNPYTHAGIIECLWTHGYYRDGNLTTPLQQGAFSNVAVYPAKVHLDQELRRVGQLQIEHPPEFESQVSYPAGSFLFPALAWLAGVQDLRLFFVLCFLGAYLFVLARAPRRLWPWIALIAYSNMTVWTNAVSGASDALYIFLVLIGWSLRRRPVASAVAMGLAVTARQQSWFFLLFYAVLTMQEEGLGGLWRRGRIIAAIFVATNLPFVVLSPGAWLSGVLSPVADPMFALGSGIIALSLGAADTVPLAPRWLYAVLELAALGGCLVLYARVCRRWPHLGLILAVVPLFFAWRSLFSYFYPVSILVLGGIADLAAHRPRMQHRARLVRRARSRQMAVRVGPGASLDLTA